MIEVIWVIYLHVCIQGECRWQPLNTSFISEQECWNFVKKMPDLGREVPLTILNVEWKTNESLYQGTHTA